MGSLLKYHGSSLNSELTDETVSLLQNYFPDTEFTGGINKEIAESFHEMAESVKRRDYDFFCWPANDIRIMEEEMDFFFLQEAGVAIIFHINNKHLNLLKQYFIPPVAFVGAGPGKPEWLTVEAKTLLDECEICFYDALVNPVIIARMPKNVKKIFVGKRGDSPSFDQDTLNELICHYAKQGLKVVRLKGGDSGILGRIVEEILTLQKYSITYTITPGISAMQGLASQTGVFLTQRGVCDRVTVTTARQAGGEVSQLMHNNRSSLVVYMGILKIEEVTSQLLEAGYSEDLPVSLAVNITRNNERYLHSTLGKIAGEVEQKKIRPPGLIIIGETAADQNRHMPVYSPILGKKIVILARGYKADRLSKEIRKWGGIPIELYTSLININEETFFPDFDHVIFMNPKEVSEFFHLVSETDKFPEQVSVSANQATDATVQCLFRLKTLIANDNNYVSTIETLRRYKIKQP